MAHLTSSVIGANLASPTTDAAFALGERQTGTDGTVWVYVQASGAITQYDYVCIDEDFQAAAGTKTSVDDGHAIGFAQAAFADDEYGWVALSGTNISVSLAASCAPDVPLYTSGTAGVLDDSSTSQTKIDGVVAVSTAGTASSNTVEVIATYPKSTTF